MAVITGRGVVGRVIGQPPAHAARVQLLAGESASAGAVIERPATAGHGAGRLCGRNTAHGTSCRAPRTIVVGDRVVTSGQDGIYPQGFLIGHVTRGQRHRQDPRNRDRPGGRISRTLTVVLVVLARPGDACRTASSEISVASSAFVSAPCMLQVLFARYRSAAGSRSTSCSSASSSCRCSPAPWAGCWPARSADCCTMWHAGGVVGVGGLLKTLVGFATGAFGTQFVVAKPYARALIVGAATVVHGVHGDRAAGGDRPAWPGIVWTAMLQEVAINAVAAYVALYLTDRACRARCRAAGRASVRPGAADSGSGRHDMLTQGAFEGRHEVQTRLLILRVVAIVVLRRAGRGVLGAAGRPAREVRRLGGQELSAHDSAARAARRAVRPERPRARREPRLVHDRVPPRAHAPT